MKKQVIIVDEFADLPEWIKKAIAKEMVKSRKVSQIKPKEPKASNEGDSMQKQSS